MSWAVIIAVPKKIKTASKDGSWKEAIPQIPCPEVQPLESRAISRRNEGFSVKKFPAGNERPSAGKKRAHASHQAGGGKQKAHGEANEQSANEVVSNSKRKQKVKFKHIGDSFGD